MASQSSESEFKAVAERVGDSQDYDIKAPWGTLHVVRGDIHGFPSALMLPNISLSPSFAREIAAQLMLAAEKGELTDKPRTAGEIAEANRRRREGSNATPDRSDYIRFDDPQALSAAGLEHLRDDAPCQRCTRCQRKTWDREQFESPCGMSQPDGTCCDGRFR